MRTKLQSKISVAGVLLGIGRVVAAQVVVGLAGCDFAVGTLRYPASAAVGLYFLAAFFLGLLLLVFSVRLWQLLRPSLARRTKPSWMRRLPPKDGVPDAKKTLQN